MVYKDTNIKPNYQNKSHDLISDSHVSGANRNAFFDLYTVNPKIPDTSPLPNFRPRPQKPPKANCRHGQPKFTTPPVVTRRNHKISPTINKVTFRK